MTEPQAYARALRTVAVFVAIGSVGLQLTGGGRPDGGVVFHLLRGGQAAIAVAIAALSTPRQSMAGLRALVGALALNITVVTFAFTYLAPQVFWEGTAILTAVMMGAALFAPWSWEWQAGLAVTVVGGTLLFAFLW